MVVIGSLIPAAWFPHKLLLLLFMRAFKVPFHHEGEGGRPFILFIRGQELKASLELCKSNLQWSPLPGRIIWVFQGPLNRNENILLFHDIFGLNGEWNLEPISFHVPPAIYSIIKSISGAFFMEEEDTIKWTASQMECLLTKRPIINSLFRKPHGTPISPFHGRVKHFIWLAFRDRLTTKVLLVKRKVNTDPFCHHYKNQKETFEHILRHYLIAQECWRHLRLDINIPFLNCLSFQECLKRDVVRGRWWTYEVSRTLFVYSYWSSWHFRNKSIYELHM